MCQYTYAYVCTHRTLYKKNREIIILKIFPPYNKHLCRLRLRVCLLYFLYGVCLSVCVCVHSAKRVSFLFLPSCVMFGLFALLPLPPSFSIISRVLYRARLTMIRFLVPSPIVYGVRAQQLPSLTATQVDWR